MQPLSSTRSLLTYLGLSFFAASILPVLNLLGAPSVLDLQSSSLRQTVRYLYSTDTLEGLRNYLFYKQGVSGNYKTAIVGKDGWLFLGDEHGKALSLARGRKTAVDNKFASEWAHAISLNQQWMASQSVPSIFVIAPIKASIYKDKLPEWLQQEEYDQTQLLVDSTIRANINLLDLRPSLLSARKDGAPLYFKRDTHWNSYGAAIGYRKTMNQINSQTGRNFRQVSNVRRQETLKKGGDVARLLKFDHILSDNDTTLTVKFPGEDDTVCIYNVNITNFMPDDNCTNRRNGPFTINQSPLYIKNPNALNHANVLWIRDSFGNANSSLFSKTFTDIWMFHYNQLHGSKLKQFILKHKPTLVIYQVVERSLPLHSVYDRIDPLTHETKSPDTGRLLFQLSNTTPLIAQRNIIFTSTGARRTVNFETVDPSPYDPNITFQTKLAQTRSALIELTIFTHAPTRLQIFFKPEKHAPFNLANSQIFPLEKGNNSIKLTIPSSLLAKPMRIDPVSNPGHYSMSLKISEIPD
jgi:alginate O-acetyltransferase complex protein AlgJ